MIPVVVIGHTYAYCQNSLLDGHHHTDLPPIPTGEQNTFPPFPLLLLDPPTNALLVVFSSC